MPLQVKSPPASPLTKLLTRRFDASEREILLCLRWLFFMILLFLFIYSDYTNATHGQIAFRVGLLFFYAVSNIALMWATRMSFSLERWSMPIFLIDVVIIGLALYNSAGPDTDLYVMCFMIIYLSTMGRHVRDALPMALMVCLLYGLLLYHRNPNVNLYDGRLLLRFPFFMVLSLFTSYLSQQAEESRRKVQHMQEVQKLMAGELQKVMVDLREKQTQLVQAEKLTAMGHMAGALAHEIRNPLSVIIGYVEDVLNERPPEDQLVKVLEAVKRSAVRCQDLMTNLLNFARRPKEMETFLLKDALQEAVTLVRISAKMTQVQCTLDVRANPLVRARRSEIQQVFINLMTNALDAMPQGGTLTISLDEDTTAGRRWIKVSVQDTGSGIPDEVRSRIFDPFFTTKPPGKGTGLGLPIVQDIIQSYQGVLEVESELHKGTTMIVRLPSEPAPPSPAAIGEAESVAGTQPAA